MSMYTGVDRIGQRKINNPRVGEHEAKTTRDRQKFFAAIENEKPTDEAIQSFKRKHYSR